MYSIAASRGPPCFTKQASKQVETPSLISSAASDELLADESTSNSSVSCDFVLPQYDTMSENDLLDDREEDFTHVIEDSKTSIEYVEDEERCSHTVVPPSSMMKLAMELQVSNRGKASKMFRNGKINAQSDSEDENQEETNSKLTGLWVVPGENVSSQDCTSGTATHLDADLKNADYVYMSRSTCDKKSLSGDDEEEKHGYEAGEENLNELLSGITAADLVGSPDRVLEPFVNETEFEPQTIATNHTQNYEATICIEQKVEISSLINENDEVAKDTDSQEKPFRNEQEFESSTTDSNPSASNELTTDKTSFDLQESIKAQHVQVESDESKDRLASSEVENAQENQEILEGESLKQEASLEYNESDAERNFTPNSSDKPIHESISNVNPNISNDLIDGCDEDNKKAMNDTQDTETKLAENFDTKTKSDIDLNNNSLKSNYKALDEKSELEVSPTSYSDVELNVITPVSFEKNTSNSDIPPNVIKNLNSDNFHEEIDNSKSESKDFPISSSSFSSNVHSSLDTTHSSVNEDDSPFLQRMTSEDINANTSSSNHQGSNTSPSVCLTTNDSNKLLAQTNAFLTDNSEVEDAEAHLKPKNSTDCGTPVASQSSFVTNNEVRRNSQSNGSEVEEQSICSVKQSSDSHLNESVSASESRSEEEAKSGETNEFSENAEKLTVTDTLSDFQPTKAEDEIDKNSEENFNKANKEVCMDCTKRMALCCCIPKKSKGLKQQSSSEKFFKNKKLNGSEDSVVKALRTLAKERLQEEQSSDTKKYVTDINSNEATADELVEKVDGVEVANAETFNCDLSTEQDEQSLQSHDEVTFGHKCSTVNENDRSVNSYTSTNQVIGNGGELQSNNGYLDANNEESSKEEENKSKLQCEEMKNPTEDCIKSEVTLQISQANLQLNNIASVELNNLPSVEDNNDTCHKESVILKEDVTTAPVLQLQAVTDEGQFLQSNAAEKLCHEKDETNLELPEVGTDEKEMVNEQSQANRETTFKSEIILSSNELNLNFEGEETAKDLQPSISNNQQQQPDELIHEVSLNPTGLEVIVKTRSSESSSRSSSSSPVSETKNNDEHREESKQSLKASVLKAKPPPVIKPKPKRNSSQSQSNQVYSSKTFVALQSTRTNPDETSPTKQRIQNSTDSGNRVVGRAASVRDTSWIKERKTSRTYTSSLFGLRGGNVKQRQQLFEAEGPTSNKPTSSYSPRMNRVKVTTSSSTSKPTSEATCIRERFAATPKESKSTKPPSYSTQRKSMQWTTKKGMPLFDETNKPVESKPPIPEPVTDDDISGVVDAPTMKVKEIRAKYKTRDYENFAKPKTPSQSSSGGLSRQQSRDSEKRRKSSGNLSDTFINVPDSPDREVAQQVMGLFQGALDFEKELAIFEEESAKAYAAFTQPKETNSRSKDEPAAVKSSPTREQDTTENVSMPTTTTSWLSNDPDEVFSSKKNDIKESVQRIKSETEAVSSFDESLDQFYDVLNDLTS